VIKCSP